MPSQLAKYVREMDFTHVEFLPVTEHPFYGSWGYQTTGYFAPTARYGTPQDFMHLVDRLHQNDVGVILDWVPSHFPTDEHGLVYFDGTYLFEHADPKRGYHQEWSSSIFNYGRHEVRSILISSALFWLDKYHVDGLRVDAVASMLYLDYARQPGEWIPNEHGGKEDIEAVQFLRDLNEAVYRDHPDTQTIAEESTAWPMVSRPTYLGGLGFGMKWNMGWMHDTLNYFSRDPIYRKYHHDQLTFSIWYAFNENFVLPFSHDEVGARQGLAAGAHAGRRLAEICQPAPAVRLSCTRHPGKKLLFMGGEFGQWRRMESRPESRLASAGTCPASAAFSRWIQDLNRCYRAEPRCIATRFRRRQVSNGSTCTTGNRASSVSCRKGDASGRSRFSWYATLLPFRTLNYRVGVPCGGFWSEAAEQRCVDLRRQRPG